MLRRIFRTILIILLGMVIGCEATSAQNAPLTWWVVGSTVKVLPTTAPPAQPGTAGICPFPDRAARQPDRAQV